MKGNISSNEYKMVPKNRDTEFGTVNVALKLTIYFVGQEIDKYETYFGALSSSYHPNEKLQPNVSIPSSFKDWILAII